MPSMANITVKNSANVDVVYVAATPSAGDTIAAVWRLNAASAVIGHRPEFTVSTRNNSRKNGRIFRATLKFPITGLDANGNPIVLATTPFEINGTLPTNVDSAGVYEAFHQLGGLLASTLVRSVASDGYAPT
jgi:hypothetical protein